MLPPRVSEHNWWWCAWRSKTPQWPHWLSSARLPGSRTSFCALSWHSPHRPGGVQITGHWDWESNRDNLYRQDTGRCQGTQVMLCKWNMTSDTNSHVAAITGYRTGNPAKMLLQSVGWVRGKHYLRGPGFDPSCSSITCGCHKIIGREKYYERLSFIDAIWKVGHVIIYFPKLKGGHKTKINLPFKYDWTIWT